MSKIAIFLSILIFIVGCGVMNNPNIEVPEDGANEAGVLKDIESIGVSKINTESLTLTNTNQNFFDGVDDIGINGSLYYKLFKKSSEVDMFLTDLNSSSQILTGEDLKTVQGWISNIKSSNINYKNSNLLFYPILQNQDCGLKDSIALNENNVTITVEDSRVECANVTIYHFLLYKVDKRVENIFLKAFGVENVHIKTTKSK